MHHSSDKKEVLFFFFLLIFIFLKEEELGKEEEEERGKKKRRRIGPQHIPPDQCSSPGDASVNARAMSRRKQGNPQHLSQREIITRKFELGTRSSRNQGAKLGKGRKRAWGGGGG